MGEVKCYGFHVNIDEVLSRRFEFVKDLKDLQNDKNSSYVGITPTLYGQCLLFKEREKRNEFLFKFRRKYRSIHKEKREMFVDEKYLAEGYKPTVEEMSQGDSGFVDFMNDFREDIKKELKKDMEFEFENLKKECQLLKSERNDLIVERNKYKYVSEQTKRQLESERSLWSKKEKNYDKKILSLEADLKRMEQANIFGING